MSLLKTIFDKDTNMKQYLILTLSLFSMLTLNAMDNRLVQVRYNENNTDVRFALQPGETVATLKERIFSEKLNCTIWCIRTVLFPLHAKEQLGNQEEYKLLHNNQEISDDTLTSFQEGMLYLHLNRIAK